MKKLAILLAAGVISQLAAAQNIVTNVSLLGSATTATQSGHDVWTRGGSPRSGTYYYWRPVTLQTTSDEIPFSFNASTGRVVTTGTYYTPHYTASCAGVTTFTNGPTSAQFSFAGQTATTAVPALPPHEWCSATASLTPRFYFSVPNDTVVTITLTGSAQSGSNLYALSGEVGPGETGNPNSYIVAGGGTYCFWATWTNNAGTGATSQKIRFNLTFSQPR